ncbi:hypothetical protein JCM19000A_36830 [Silvimonas sp. JCM 19000]
MNEYSDKAQRATRHSVRWRVVLLTTDGRQAFGRSGDLSISGASVYLDLYLQMHTEALLYLEIPARPDGIERQIVQIPCRVVYTVHDNVMSQFRTGIQFLQLDDLSRDALQRAFKAYFHRARPVSVAEA